MAMVMNLAIGGLAGCKSSGADNKETDGPTVVLEVLPQKEPEEQASDNSNDYYLNEKGILVDKVEEFKTQEFGEYTLTYPILEEGVDEVAVYEFDTYDNTHVVLDATNIYQQISLDTIGDYGDGQLEIVAPGEDIKYMFDGERYYIEEVLTPNFVSIVNERQKERIKKLIDYNKVIAGGEFDGLILQPTVMDNVTEQDSIMQEEVFGPIMPIISFSSLKEELDKLSKKEKPLAFYYFSTDQEKQIQVMQSAHFGGGCINDCILHLTEHNLPFGGVGASGMGSYHGKKTFDTFTHHKSVLVNNTKINLWLKFMPYTRRKLKFLKWFSK